MILFQFIYPRRVCHVYTHADRICRGLLTSALHPIPVPVPALDPKTKPFLTYKGRDFESTFTNHKYTEEEKQTLTTYEGHDYLPSHSDVYKNWIKRQPSR